MLDMLEIQQIPEKDYKDILLKAESKLKQIFDKKQSVSDVEQLMEKQFGLILSYMCSQGAYQKPFYARSIVLMDNVIPRTNCIHDLFKSDRFCQNVRRSFEKICELIQQRTNLQKKLNLLYAHLYMMLYLIKICQENIDLLTALYYKVFGSYFLVNFSVLPFKQMDQNSIRVGSMIIANLVSKGFLKDIQSGHLIKSVCGLCSNCHDSVARSYLILALYHMKQLLCKNELRKNNVIRMLVSTFERGSERQTQRILVTLSTILQCHPQLAHDLVQTNFLQLWQYRFAIFPELSLRILKLFLPVMDKSIIEKWLRLHLQQFWSNRSKVTKLQLMVCDLLIKNLYPLTCLMLLSEGILQGLDGKWQKQLQKHVSECKESLFQILKQADPNLLAAYKNFLLKNTEQDFRELQ